MKGWVHLVGFLALVTASAPLTAAVQASAYPARPHLVGEMFRTVTGAQTVHGPYKGSGPAVVDLAAGNVRIMFDAPPSLYAQIKAAPSRAPFRRLGRPRSMPAS
jgi:tripartite-type tricarboxylate transporter receptor subunit TctC